MSVSYWQQPPGVGTAIECDVVVIGAGIVGAYAAHVLTTRGRKVTVLESRYPAAGATGRNAGFCLTGAADNYASAVKRWGRDRARELWRLTFENQRKMREFVERFRVPYESCGGWILAESDEEAVQLRQAHEWMRADGFPVGFQETDPLGRGFCAGLLQPEDFGLDPVALTTALWNDAGSHGARLFAPAEVFAIHRFADGKLLVEARGVRAMCDRVALCTNAYSPLIDSFFDGLVSPVRGQLFATTPLRRRVLDRLAYSDFGYYYFRQLPDGAFLLGGARHHHRDLEVGYDDAATEWVQASLEEYLRRHFPDVAREVSVARRWAGTMGFSVDGMPLVGELPEVPGHFSPVRRNPSSLPRKAGRSGIHFAVGMTGHGNGWGMVAADFMIGQMLGEREDAGLFDFRRLPAT